ERLLVATPLNFVGDAADVPRAVEEEARAAYVDQAARLEEPPVASRIELPRGLGRVLHRGVRQRLSAGEGDGAVGGAAAVDTRPRRGERIAAAERGPSGAAAAHVEHAVVAAV